MKRGFTVVELLLAIFVILLLAALLFPIVTTARAKGRLAARLADYRALGTALDLYSDSADDRYCPSTLGSSPWTKRLDGIAKESFPDDPGRLNVGLNLATAVVSRGCWEWRSHRVPRVYHRARTIGS